MAEARPLADVQSTADNRDLEIDKVGVKNVRYPIVVLDKIAGTQQTVASISMFVDLPRQFRGTHMSRFVEILNEFRGRIGIRDVARILEEMKRRLEATSAHLEVSFPYFIEKKAPVSGASGLMEYECAILAELKDQQPDIVVEVSVPITTLCPCSREIADFGAHNQRARVKVRFRFNRFVWIEDIITLVEQCASSEVYSVLKREDEKYVTERAYHNPAFVEDVVRSAAQRLAGTPGVTWYSVEAEAFESIHNHSAYAFIDGGRVA
ncbi:MAG: GTP cyclohydrolase FolE2 [Pseudomonadota bacterium]